MNRAQFCALLERRGSDLDKWPESERSAAQRLIASDTATAGDLAEALRFDRQIKRGLSSRSFPDTPEDVASRILSRLGEPLPAQVSSESPARNWLGRGLRRLCFSGLPDLAFNALWPQAAAMAVAAVLGIVCGVYGAQHQISQDQQTQLVFQQESDADLTGVLSGNRETTRTYQ